MPRGDKIMEKNSGYACYTHRRVTGSGESASAEDFIRTRITQLRVKKDVSEYEMSLSLGHSRSYIQNISSGRALPSMTEFLAICSYLGVTPGAFFEDASENPLLVQKALEGLQGLSEDDILLLIRLINRLKAK